MWLRGFARMRSADQIRHHDVKIHNTALQSFSLHHWSLYNFMTQSAFLQDDWGMKWSSGHASDLRAVCISRHMYENIAREFVLDIPNVKVQTGAVVSGLEYNTSTSQVTGSPLLLS